MVERIKVWNYKSIRRQTVDLRQMNVLIGQNGAGKSNFISLFSFLEKLVAQGLADFIPQKGGFNTFLCGGLEQSKSLGFTVWLSGNDSPSYNTYECKLINVGSDYRFAEEFVGY